MLKRKKPQVTLERLAHTLPLSRDGSSDSAWGLCAWARRLGKGDAGSRADQQASEKRKTWDTAPEGTWGRGRGWDGKLWEVIRHSILIHYFPLLVVCVFCLKTPKQMSCSPLTDNWFMLITGRFSILALAKMVFLSDSEPPRSDQCVPTAICHLL